MKTVLTQTVSLLAAAALAVVPLFATQAGPPRLQRHEAIAAYIYNFAKNVEWRNEEAKKDFRIHVFGDDPAVLRELLGLSKIKTLRNRPIVVSTSESLSDCTNAQLIFIPKSSESHYVDIYERVEGKRILLVSDNYSEKRLIMINFIDAGDGALQFEINMENIDYQHLRVMQDMILLGGTKVDVAALYLEGQRNLRDLQKQKDKLEGTLRNLNDSIVSKTREIQDLKDNLDRQTVVMQQQSESLARQALKIQEQESVLDAQRIKYKEQEDNLRIQIVRMHEQQLMVEEKSRELAEQQQELRKGDDLLKSQQATMKTEQEQILSQADILREQGATIHWQTSILYLLLIIIVLVVALVLTIYRGYSINQRLNRELKHKVAELAVAKERAESADRLKSAFLATMSHELRTPLNTIIGFTSIILQGLVGALSDEQRKQLNMVRDSAHHLLALINDVLDISKIEAGQIEMKYEDFMLQEAIEKSLQFIKPICEKKSLTIAQRGPMISTPVHSDRRRVEQILINLLSNAAKFTDRGGITLTVSETEGRHGESSGTESRDRPDAMLRISVTDTGIGIKHEDLGKLFKPFIQIDAGTSRRYEGTGLGLSISNKLVEMLGGEIEAQSDGPNQGATFTFTLPLGGSRHG